MTTRWRSVLISTFAVVAIVSFSACGGGDSTSTGTDKSTPSSPDPDETSVTIGVICTSPSEAAETVVSAWEASDKAAALRCSNTETVDQLFKTSGASAEWVFQGCTTTTPEKSQCPFTYEGGAAFFTVTGSDAMGWQASSLSYSAD